MRQLAAAALRVAHRESNRATCCFLRSLLRYGRNPADPQAAVVMQALNEQGTGLVAAVVEGISGELPSSRVDDEMGSLTSCLWEISAISKAGLQALLTPALAGLPPHVCNDSVLAAAARCHYTAFVLLFSNP